MDSLVLLWHGRYRYGNSQWQSVTSYSSVKYSWSSWNRSYYYYNFIYWKRQQPVCCLVVIWPPKETEEKECFIMEISSKYSSYGELQPDLLIIMVYPLFGKGQCNLQFWGWSWPSLARPRNVGSIAATNETTFIILHAPSFKKNILYLSLSSLKLNRSPCGIVLSHT